MLLQLDTYLQTKKFFSLNEKKFEKKRQNI